MLADFVRETDLDVVMLAGRYTLLEQGALDDLLPECERRDVSVIAAGVFNSGLLARDRPRDGRHLQLRARAAGAARARRTASPTCWSATARACPSPRRSSRSPIPPWRPSASARAPPRRSSATPRCSTTPVPDAAWSELVAEGLLRPDAPIPSRWHETTMETELSRPLLLEVRGVSKSFPGVKALEDMHLDLRAGEVLALVGENGAGKSTLMKLLSGIYAADAGEFFLNGEPLRADVAQARAGARASASSIRSST